MHRLSASSEVSLGHFLNWLNFSEPEVRVRKVVKALSKGSSSSDAASSPEKERMAVLLAILLSLAEIERFRDIAFRCCDFTSQAALIASSRQTIESLLPAFGKWAELESLSDPKRMWIALSAVVLPEVLRADSTDPRIQKIITFLRTVQAELARECTDGLHDIKTMCAFMTSARSIFHAALDRARNELPANFLPCALILVEGPTEQFLIPRFASLLGRGLKEEGLHLITSGGANQVLKRYLHWSELVELPIACVLDRDAEQVIEVLSESLRDCDQLTVFANGEIEDAFDLKVFVDLLNAYLKSLDGVNCPSLIGSQPITKDDFTGETTRRNALKRLWKKRALGDFDKVDFARFVSERLTDSSKVPKEISKMMHALGEKTRSGLDG